MNRRPHEPLSAEERMLAAQLPRLHGRGEPTPALDARILGAARAAVGPPPALRQRIRWIAPMAVAASLSLAVGLAWRLQPPPTPSSAAVAVAPVADAENAEMQAARGPVSAIQSGQERPAAALPEPSSRPGDERARAIDDEPAPKAAQVPQAAPPPAPPAPPAPPPPAPMVAAETRAAADMVSAPLTAPAVRPSVAKATQPVEAMRARQATAASAVSRTQANEASMAAEATGKEREAFVVGDPGEDVPPATVDSPEVRSAWLRRIGELMKEGRTEDARASLAEFRRRYPDAPLPSELRTLEP